MVSSDCTASCLCTCEHELGDHCDAGREEWENEPFCFADVEPECKCLEFKCATSHEEAVEQA